MKSFNEQLAIGLIGAGAIANAHIQAIKKCFSRTQIYMCDIDEKKFDAFKNKPNIEGFYSNLTQMIKENNISSLHILTPPSTHFDLAQKGLELGCHVLIEKPPTSTYQEIHSLYKLASKKGKLVHVDFSQLNTPLYLRVKSLINSENMGRLISAHCHLGVSKGKNKLLYKNHAHWAYQNSSGLIINWLVHPLSILVDLMDPITDVQCQYLKRNYLPNQIYDMCHLKIQGHDQFGSVSLSMGHGNNEKHVDLFFENGTIFIDLLRHFYIHLNTTGASNFLNRALSGIKFGINPIFSTVANLAKLSTGKLQRNPGIMGVVSNFYDTILHQKKLNIDRETILQISKILDQISKFNLSNSEI